jgi:hypothetical protein
MESEEPLAPEELRRFLFAVLDGRADLHATLIAAGSEGFPVRDAESLARLYAEPEGDEAVVAMLLPHCEAWLQTSGRS